MGSKDILKSCVPNDGVHAAITLHSQLFFGKMAARTIIFQKMQTFALIAASSRLFAKKIT